MNPARAIRPAATVIAVTAMAALLLQAAISIAEMTANGLTVVVAGWRFIGYFTILTNLLVAIVMARAATGRAMGPSLYAAVTLYIAIVGIVYHAMLAQLYDPVGWKWVATHGLHTAVPLMTVAAWLTLLPKRGLTWADPFLWLVYPLGYFAAVLVRGAIEGWYPYPFVDAGTIGLARALINAAALSGVFLIGGLALVALARLLKAA